MNLHAEYDETKKDEQIVSLEVFYVFHKPLGERRQSLRNPEPVGVDKLRPGLHALPCLGEPLAGRSVGQRDRHDSKTNTKS